MKSILLPSLTLLFCLNGFAQETASSVEKLDTIEGYYSDSDTIERKKREIGEFENQIGAVSLAGFRKRYLESYFGKRSTKSCIGLRSTESCIVRRDR